MIQSKNHYKLSNLLIGAFLGASVLGAFATIQFLMIVGHIAPQNYMVPLTIGTLFGGLLAHGLQKLRLADKQIKDQHRTLNLVLDGIEVGIWDWNPQTNEVFFDSRWCKLLGYEQSELPPSLETWSSRVHPDDIEQTMRDVQNHMHGKTDFYSNVHRMQHKDGHWVYILDRGQIIERDSSGQPIRFTGTHVDISHIKEIEHQLASKNRKLKELSLIDGLTGLKNRRALDEYMQQQWAYWKRDQTPFCILMLDIDCFKQYNDFYGHVEGDKCLKKVAKDLNSHANRTNDMAVRYGGEEFLMAYSGLNHEQGLEMAEKVRKSIENLAIPHEKSSVSKVITISIGIYSCDNKRPCSSILEPIDNADQALYLAKKRGRNQVSSC